MKYLLLGPGTSRKRYGGADFGFDNSDELVVVDMNGLVQPEWPDATFINYDLREGLFQARPLPIESDSIDEIHAYELLNLLPGDEYKFFSLWRELWRVLKPGGTVTASVPHWQSQWIHAYPAPQRTYTPGLLTYLDNDVKVAAKSDFSQTQWPKPFRFAIINMLEDPHKQGFVFMLRKVVDE